MTKKVFFLALLAITSWTIVNAQSAADSTKKAGSWSTSSTPALKLGEFFFNNWSASGNSQIDVTATFFGNYKYTHPKFVWDNIADLAYGYAWQDLAEGDTLFETHRKSNDKIDLTSSISWKAYKNWGASFSANLKSQFGAGFTYDGVGPNAIATQVSGFMSPGYLTTALSFEHKRDNWSVSVSFITGKTTFVINDSLIANGYSYGVIQKDPASFTHAYFALGSYIKGMYLKKDLLPSLDLYARAELFYDYKKPRNMSWNDLTNTTYTSPLNDDGTPYETMADLSNFNWMKKRFFESDLDFEVKLDYRFAKFLSANFALNMKWDTDFNGIGNWGHWQVYQMAGLQLYFNWKTPKS